MVAFNEVGGSSPGLSNGLDRKTYIVRVLVPAELMSIEIRKTSAGAGRRAILAEKPRQCLTLTHEITSVPTSEQDLLRI